MTYDLNTEINRKVKVFVGGAGSMIFQHSEIEEKKTITHWPIVK
jgi:hypothetical protein